MLLASALLALSALPSVFISEDFDRALGDWRSYWQLLIYFGVATNLLACGMRETVVRVLAVSSILSCLRRLHPARRWPRPGLHSHIGAAHRVSSTLYTMTFAGIHRPAHRVLLGDAHRAHRPSRATALRRRGGAAARRPAADDDAGRMAGRRGRFRRPGAARAQPPAAGGGGTRGGCTGWCLHLVYYANDEGRTISIQALFSSSPDRNVHTRIELWKTAWQPLRGSTPSSASAWETTPSEAAKMLAGSEGRADHVGLAQRTPAHPRHAGSGGISFRSFSSG